MLILVPVAVGLVFAVTLRQTTGWPHRRTFLGLTVLALGVRLAAVLVIYLIARQTHAEGTWLNDEASFFLATESLIPDPLNRALPVGLDHLGGDGYLGITTGVSLVMRVVDSNALRVTNAALGALAVVISTLVAKGLFGTRAAVMSGIVLSLWPTLVLWSATFLRDILAGVLVLAMWWTLSRASDLGRVRTWVTVVLAIAVLMSLRPYLGAASAAGVAAWAVTPALRRLRRTHALALGVAGLAIASVGIVAEARRVDYAVHDLIYRQTVTRIETLGLLYTDFPPETADLPVRPGAAVAVADPRTGWLLTGVVQDMPRDQEVQVAFTDETIRTVPLAQVQPIQGAAIPPMQLLAWIAPNLWSYLTGTSLTSAPSNVGWVAAALTWDFILVLAAASAIWLRVGVRELLFPACVIAGTTLALIAIPGAPGNADRHRTTQTLPALVVLASGLLSLRSARTALDGVLVKKPRMIAISDGTAAISRIRSAR